MAVKSKDELIESIKALLGEDTSDEGLALLEDVADTFESNQIDWKTKYEENDRDWRNRYRDRFLGNDDDDGFEEEIEPKKKLTYADLFSTIN